MVGTTVQTMQKVGWIAVTPIERLELPYWAGLWLGLYPTWQGLVAQAAAALFVVGSYFAAEASEATRARLVASSAAAELSPAEPATSGSRRRPRRRARGDALAAGSEDRTRCHGPPTRVFAMVVRQREHGSSVATVDAELVLHRPRRAVGSGVVA